MDFDIVQPGVDKVKLKFVAVLFLISFLPSPMLAAPGTRPKGIPDAAVEATVTGHVDGEKFKATIDGEEREIRMIGIDAPELTGENDLPECYANESLDHLREVIPTGSTVYLEKDAEDKDSKDRLWRWVWMEGPTTIVPDLLNEELTDDGYAIDREEEKNTRYDSEIAKAEQSAREDETGLWEECGGGHVETTPVPEPGSKDAPGEVGETLTAESVDVTITNAFFTYEYAFGTPKGGYVFLILEVEIQNNGQDKNNYSSGRWEAYNAVTNAKYEETFLFLDVPLDSGELSAGEYVSGQVALEVQDTPNDLRVQYQISDFGENFVNWLVPRT